MNNMHFHITDTVCFSAKITAVFHLALRLENTLSHYDVLRFKNLILIMLSKEFTF